MNQPLRVGVIGMGGFAGVHHNAVLELESAGECQLVCTCDPCMDAFAARQKALHFSSRGVRLFSDYLPMLDACRDELDVVTIPTPVPLHPPMHRACVERGIAVYLEKPPTLDYAALEGMLEVEKKASHLTVVGFNHIIEPERQRLKQCLAGDEFGKVKRIVVSSLGPRADSYYARAAWAGRLMLDGQLVLDSPMGNAMAHQVHNALFWCGQGDLWSWGEADEVEAELYRAHAIEGTDTVFLRATMAGGASFLLALSHACAHGSDAEEIIECEHTTITCTFVHSAGANLATRFSIRWRDGREETWQQTGFNYLSENLRAYFAYVRGQADRPLTRLLDSRPFVHLNGLAYVAGQQIATVPAGWVERSPEPGGKGDYVAIQGLDSVLRRFVATGELPSEQGVPWARKSGRASAAELPRLREAVEEMALLSRT